MGNDVLFVSSRNEWRSWLETNFRKEKGIWLALPNKSLATRNFYYNDAVEEALCFGWIDSTLKKLDDNHRVQRFTPRKKGSPFSQYNIERLRWLDDNGLLHPEIRKSVLEILQQVFTFPQDIIDEIKKHDKAWENYCAFSEPYKRIRIAHIESMRSDPGEFNKRLEAFIKKTADNKHIFIYEKAEKYFLT